MTLLLSLAGRLEHDEVRVAALVAQSIGAFFVGVESELLRVPTARSGEVLGWEPRGAIGSGKGRSEGHVGAGARERMLPSGPLKYATFASSAKCAMPCASVTIGGWSYCSNDTPCSVSCSTTVSMSSTSKPAMVN